MPISRKQLVFYSLLCIALLFSACTAQSTTTGAEPTALPYTPEVNQEAPAQAAEVTEGDPTKGKAVFDQYCASCHSVEQAVSLVGPSLFQAGTRLTSSFIQDSIRHPLQYINPAYEDTGMPEYISEVLTEQEFNDLVSYVLELK